MASADPLSAAEIFNLIFYVGAVISVIKISEAVGSDGGYQTLNAECVLCEQKDTELSNNVNDKIL